MKQQGLQSQSRRGLIALTVLVALLLAACGGSGSDGASKDASATAGASSEAPGTVTIDHRFGSTEVPVDPEKIVSLDLQWTDVLLSLEKTPAAYIPDPTLGKDFPWQGDQLGDVTHLDATVATGLPIEKIAAQKPDLIVVTYLAEDKAAYDKLAAIAPTIASLAGDQVDTWQDITTAAGKVLGEPDKAEDLIADVDGQVADVAAELPGLEGKTAAMANYVPGDALYIVSDPEDGANVLFSQLGMSIPQSILDAGTSQQGRVKLSLENVGILDDADMLVLFTNGADPNDIPGYSSLHAVETGAVANLDYADVVSLNTPTPMSIPYGLEKIRPALEAAAEG